MPTQVKIQRESIEITYAKERLSEDLELELVQIPAGEFLMGSPESESDRLDTEGPQHKVQVPSFWMGQYPVTQAEWQVVAGYPQIELYLNPQPAYFEGDYREGDDRLPVDNINWFEAVEFCKRLSAYTNRGYRLPSEAEWEYACRARTTTPFHFGEMMTTDLANYRGTDDESFNWSGSYGEGPKGEYREWTTPVGQFGVANAFGLFDMHGNVWEWCLDHWHTKYRGAPRDGNAWLSENDNDSRVIRGGAWNDYPRDCRSARRDSDSPEDRNDLIGFRVVVSPRGSS